MFSLRVSARSRSTKKKTHFLFFFFEKKKKLNRRFPHLGCELMEFPKGRHLEPPQWDRGPAFSSFESGYISGAFFSFGAVRRALEEKRKEEKVRDRG